MSIGIFHWHEAQPILQQKSRSGTVTILQKIDPSTYEVEAAGQRWRYDSTHRYVLGQKLQAKVSVDPVQPITGSSLWHGLTQPYVFDYNAWLVAKGLAGTLEEKKATRKGMDNAILLQWTRNFDTRLDRVFAQQRTQALLKGMLIGDRSDFSNDQYQSFIQSGLVHIIAVSGGNIIVLITLLNFLLLRVPVRVRRGMLIVAVVAYGGFVGLESSVLRAVVMGVLGLLGLLLGRQVDIRRSMAIAYIAMVVLNPYSLVYDAGLILSFSSLAGLVRAEERYQEYSVDSRWAHKILGSYIVPTFGALAGVSPFLLLLMGQVNLMTIVANLLVLPIVSLVTVAGLLAMGVGVSGVVFPIDWLVNWIFGVSNWAVTYGIFIQALGVSVQILMLTLLLYVIYKNHNK